MVTHKVKLRGLRSPQIGLSGTTPTLLSRMDADPISGVLGDLQDPELKAIEQTLVTQFTKDDPWKFYQPVHRVFHIVLLEAFCDPYDATEGTVIDTFRPRLDPLKIDSAGLVLRRYAQGRSGQMLTVQEGWRTLDSRSIGEGSSAAKLCGWVPIANAALEQDPDIQRRLAQPAALSSAVSSGTGQTRLKLGRPALDRKLSIMQTVEAGYAEQISPLFVAPPEVCEALGKTVLYALVPLTSPEISESSNLDDAFTVAEIKERLPDALRETPEEEIKRSDETLRKTKLSFNEYRELVRQLVEELDLLKDTTFSRNLILSLNGFRLFDGDTSRPAGEVLKEAAEAAVTTAGLSGDLLPTAWGVIGRGTENNIAQAVMAILQNRLGQVSTQLRRFDELERRYTLRAFIRVKSDDGCAPQLCWSPNSETFTIRPWYDNSPAQPVQVALPDILGEDRNLLEKLKPNVAFSIPPGLFDEIEGMTLQDLLDGKKPSKDKLGIGWICGFNIPIITICAFIVLNIFLQLLNFIFWWLPFIKICVPIPQRSQGGN